MRIPLKEVRLHIATHVCGALSSGASLKAAGGLRLTYDSEIEAVVCERDGAETELIPVGAVVQMKPEAWPADSANKRLEAAAAAVERLTAKVEPCVAPSAPEPCAVCAEESAALAADAKPVVTAARNRVGEYGVTIPDGATEATVRIEEPPADPSAPEQGRDVSPSSFVDEQLKDKGSALSHLLERVVEKPAPAPEVAPGVTWMPRGMQQPTQNELANESMAPLEVHPPQPLSDPHKPRKRSRR